MPDLTSALEEAISAAERQRKALSKRKSRQVTSSEERAMVKSMALAWFNSQRTTLTPLHNDSLLKSIDQLFQQLLEFSDQSTTRTRYKTHLKTIKQELIKLRSQAVMLINTGQITGGEHKPPDFKKLVSDEKMNAILLRRWEETIICKESSAPLAAIVMMGALLEALLLARANRLNDMSKLFKAKSAPIDAKTKKPRPLKEWTLKNYLDVGHELKWIVKSAKDVGEILRDYRNYIHPEKELKHGIVLEDKDARMFWVVFRSIAEQVIESI